MSGSLTPKTGVADGTTRDVMASGPLNKTVGYCMYCFFFRSRSANFRAQAHIIHLGVTKDVHARPVARAAVPHRSTCPRHSNCAMMVCTPLECKTSASSSRRAPMWAVRRNVVRHVTLYLRGRLRKRCRSCMQVNTVGRDTL